MIYFYEFTTSFRVVNFLTDSNYHACLINRNIYIASDKNKYADTKALFLFKINPKGIYKI